MSVFAELKPRACGVYVFVHAVSAHEGAPVGSEDEITSDGLCIIIGYVDVIDHRNRNLFETFIINTIPINL